VAHPLLPVRYLICELSGNLLVFGEEAAAGEVSQSLKTYSPNAPGGPEGHWPDRWASALAITPDGRFLYAANRKQPDDQREGAGDDFAIFQVSLWKEGRRTESLLDPSDSCGTNAPRVPCMYVVRCPLLTARSPCLGTTTSRPRASTLVTWPPAAVNQFSDRDLDFTGFTTAILWDLGLGNHAHYIYIYPPLCT
jgi:hypothetical protein